jgi:hypothetical protein
VVDIEAYETRTFEVPVENITVEGLAAENEITFPQNVVYVNITGLAVDLDDLNAKAIRGNVDVTDLDTGSHVLDVELDVDENKFVVASSRAQININSKNADTEPEDGEGEDITGEAGNPAGTGDDTETDADVTRGSEDEETFETIGSSDAGTEENGDSEEMEEPESVAGQDR